MAALHHHPTPPYVPKGRWRVSTHPPRITSTPSNLLSPSLNSSWFHSLKKKSLLPPLISGAFSHAHTHKTQFEFSGQNENQKHPYFLYCGPQIWTGYTSQGLSWRTAAHAAPTSRERGGGRRLAGLQNNPIKGIFTLLFLGRLFIGYTNLSFLLKDMTC